MILYEYPFNERIRAWLRLEHLYDLYTELCERTQAIDHHFALSTLFEILDVVCRPDLKSEIMRDLDKQKNLLNAYRGNPAVAEKALDEMLYSIESSFSQLASMAGKVGHELIENDWQQLFAAASTFQAALASLTCLPTTHGNTCQRRSAKATCNAG